MRGFRHWRWHLDEMYVKLNGEMVYLWRAVDHEGEVLESYVTKTRDKAAALTFMKKALKRHGSPDGITTDGLRSYGAAMNELGNREKQEVGRWANNRVESSPQVDHLAVQLHVYFVQMPAPVAEPPHATDPLTANVACEQRTEPVPPQPDRLVADVDPALEQQILHVAQRQGKAHVHQHHQPDHLGRRVEVAESTDWLTRAGHANATTPP